VNSNVPLVLYNILGRKLGSSFQVIGRGAITRLFGMTKIISVIMEETLHIVCGCIDTKNPDYDQSIFWRWSSGTEMWDGKRKAGTITSKLPRGYRKNQ